MSLFKRAVQRYGITEEPVTPYQRAAQLWDDRIGSARVQARNWRFMAFGCLALATGLAGAVVWQSAQSRVTPYVVEVDKLGEVKAVGPATRDYQPSDAEVAWYLARFITDVRSVPLDPVVLRQDWLEAYDYATDHAAVFLNGYARANDPFNSVGEKSVAVQVTSVVRVSDESFQVKWTEQSYDHSALSGTAHWTAILSTVTQPPKTEDVLRRNPLGIYVNGLDWSRELNPGESP